MTMFDFALSGIYTRTLASMRVIKQCRTVFELFVFNAAIKLFMIPSKIICLFQLNPSIEIIVLCLALKPNTSAVFPLHV